MQTLFAEHGLMRRHPPAAAFPDGGFDVLQPGAVQPDAVGQVGRAQGLVAGGILAVAGGADGVDPSGVAQAFSDTSTGGAVGVAAICTRAVACRDGFAPKVWGGLIT